MGGKAVSSQPMAWKVILVCAFWISAKVVSWESGDGQDFSVSLSGIGTWYENFSWLIFLSFLTVYR